MNKRLLEAELADAIDSFRETQGRSPDATEISDMKQMIKRDMNIRNVDKKSKIALRSKDNKISSMQKEAEKESRISWINKKEYPDEYEVYDTLSDKTWNVRKRAPGRGRKNPKRIIIDQSSVKKKGIPSDVVNKTHFISANRAFFNPKTGKFWVNGLSGDRPRDAKEYYEITGKAAIKARQMESERYNERVSRSKSAKKGVRKRKYNLFKKNLSDTGNKTRKFFANQADFDAAAERMDAAGQKTKKAALWSWGKTKKGASSTKRVAWTNPLKRDRQRKHIAHPTSGVSGMARRGSRKIESFGYALPGPFAVFTLAWKKMTKALKLLTVIVFALVIFFVPWGVFYYSGWAVAAAFMFLLSVIYWVFISLFNGIASVLVTLINGLVRMMMSAVIWAVEAITKFFVIRGTPPKIVNGVQVPPEYWVDGHALLENSMIQYDQIANAPSLMIVVTPGWKEWMNTTIIGKIIEWFGWNYDLSWLTSPFKEVYEGLPAEQALVLGLLIILIPIVLLVWVYYQNRHHLYA